MSDTFEPTFEGDKNNPEFNSEAEKDSSSHKVGVFLGSLTLIGTIIGGGVVSLPHSLRKLGLIFGVVANILNAMAAYFAVLLLIKAKNITGHAYVLYSLTSS